MKELFSNPEVLNLINQAMASRKSISFNTGDVRVNIIPTENTLSIKIEEKSEIDKFKDYINNLPDDVYVKVCEQLGKEKIDKITKCIESSDLESNRSGIIAFKNAVREYAITQITLYKNILKEC